MQRLMSFAFITLSKLTLDVFLFHTLQALLFLFVVFAAILNWFKTRKACRGQSSMPVQVIRSDASMGLFYGTYAAISGLLIALCLSVDVAKNHRVVWVVFDAIIVAYVCLFNSWFRNKLVQWTQYLTKIEKR